MFDLFATFAVPVVGILLHLSMMDRRFYIVKGFGPLPATYWDTWGVIGMAVSDHRWTVVCSFRVLTIADHSHPDCVRSGSIHR
jgi:hypothetical protein